MSAPHIRPSFELVLPEDPDRVMERLRARMPDCPRCTGVSVGRHAEIFVPEEERRVWSPWLSVTTRTTDDGGARLRGRFAPHPSVWTFYMFLAFGLGTAIVAGIIWGCAQWVLDATPWALLCLPVGLLLAAGLYLVSLAGQRLGHGQLEHLKETLVELVVADEGP